MRKLLAHLGISLLSVFATLLLLECALRIVSPQDLAYWDSDPFRRIQAEPPHFVENIPNTHANFLGTAIVINSQGLRGPEIQTPRPSNTVRILVVGDSVTFGYGVPFESTYPRALERFLNQDARADKDYEVLNGGTLGGSLGDYYHFLMQKGPSLRPNLVVVGITLNDILVYSPSGGVSGEGAEWQGHHMPLVRRVSHFLLRHSHLYLFAYSRLKSFFYSAAIFDANTMRGVSFSALQPPSAYQTEAWASSQEMLLRIVNLCREKGYDLMFGVFPMQMQISSKELQFYRDQFHLRLGEGALSGEPQARLREFGLKTGVPVIDLLPAFREHDSREMYLHNNMIPADPTHPSVQGNEVAAAEIYRVLKTRWIK